MIINHNNIDNLKILENSSKQKIYLIKNLISINKKIVLSSLKKSLKKPTKTFTHKNKIVKYEFNDYKKFNKILRSIYLELYSKKFINKLKHLFEIKDLFPDDRNLYSGLNYSKKNAVLKEHIDFNYNNNLKKYRFINLLLYLNNNYKKTNGGRFYYYSKSKSKKIYIDPNYNNTVIFVTNKNLPHGFTRVKKDRFSLNLYYYTKKNLTLSKKKHKTLWINNA